MKILRTREKFLPDGLLNPVQSAGRCNGCGCFLNGVYELDHIYPKSRGGSEDPQNFQMLCPPCNGEKGNKTMTEWLLIPNARCRSFWAGREHLAPLGKFDAEVSLYLPRDVSEITERPPIVEITIQKPVEDLETGYDPEIGYNPYRRHHKRFGQPKPKLKPKSKFPETDRELLEKFKEANVRKKLNTTFDELKALKIK